MKAINATIKCSRITNPQATPTPPVPLTTPIPTTTSVTPSQSTTSLHERVPLPESDAEQMSTEGTTTQDGSDGAVQPERQTEDSGTDDDSQMVIIGKNFIIHSF